MYLDNLIIGVGVKNFRLIIFWFKERYVESELSCATHPHNSYLQLLINGKYQVFIFLIIILLYF